MLIFATSTRFDPGIPLTLSFLTLIGSLCAHLANPIIPTPSKDFTDNTLDAGLLRPVMGQRCDSGEDAEFNRFIQRLQTGIPELHHL
ncbi:hypothetical protein B9Q03_13370 [Candidatus Marsarchaeota G2 archaeon OSP_D]|uniref:Uncharacterized protein n=1 Tax=Candidatus Marsarchaeota G2 archaeon OSP_D TaxID=1978157 RepID=A0A2R6AB92_9ARCH|nr:MAG: hypothetical protein B9Q03_13370 [Candidatus Marsarchaeota G2 archaeon OSP_D]